MLLSTHAIARLIEVVVQLDKFRDSSGTAVLNSGLSRHFRDGWQLCKAQAYRK